MGRGVGLPELVSIVFFLGSALLAFVSVRVSWISHGLGIARAGQKTLKGASSCPEWASLCAPRQQGREADEVEAGQGWALPLPGFPRCTPPRTPAPQHWLVLRASWSVCLPLTPSLCVPLGGVPPHSRPSPAAEFSFWSQHLPAWAGPGRSSVVWVPPHSQRAWSLCLGVGALGPKASPWGRRFPRGFTCPV